MKPLIGLTPTLSDGRPRITLNMDYAEAVRRSGAAPVLLPLTDDEATLEALCERLDGLILTGGDDISPEMYGEEPIPECGATQPLRDRMELYLLRRCLETGKPFLAICRGFEIMNIGLGGTLYQDIATQRPGSLRHPCYEVPADQVHTVVLSPDSTIARLTGLSECRVNSRHHQGVKKVGGGLRVSAVASDGLVEGLELPGHPFALGVQWHPETLSAFAQEAQCLFDALRAAAEGGSST